MLNVLLRRKKLHIHAEKVCGLEQLLCQQYTEESIEPILREIERLKKVCPPEGGGHQWLKITVRTARIAIYVNLTEKDSIAIIRRYARRVL